MSNQLSFLSMAQVDSSADDFYLGERNASMLALAEEYCGPDTTTDTSCNLRTAFFYATSLAGNDVEISVNVGQEDLSLEQSTPIQVSG